MKETDPKLAAALGMKYLMQYLNGETIRGITRTSGRNRDTVVKFMRKAAALAVDAAQETVMRELFPQVVAVYKAQLEQQLTNAKEGKPIDMTHAQQIMKSMYVFDSPQLKDSVKVDGDLNEGQETLAGFILHRPSKQLQQPINVPSNLKVIEGVKVTPTTNGDKDNPPDAQDDRDDSV